MSDKEIDKSDERREQLIPRCVGLYIRKPEEKIVEVLEIDSETVLNSVERRICNFYKCTKSFTINENSNEDKVKCFATRNTEINFYKHLTESHTNEELFCVYCYFLEKKSIKYYSNRYLIKHMFKRHRFRRFQCNQCLYRAITEDHVNIHQSITHKTSYLKTINNELNGEQNKCKIFKCLPIKNENSIINLHYYYKKFKSDRFNNNGINESHYQCVYCDFMCEDINKVVEHCVELHLDYPIMYFIPESLISSSTCFRANDNILLSSMSVNTCLQSVKPKTEPQDNSVSSTSTLIIDNKVNEIDINCNESNSERNSISDIEKLKAIESAFEKDFGIPLNSLLIDNDINNLQVNDLLKAVDIPEHNQNLIHSQTCNQKEGSAKSNHYSIIAYKHSDNSELKSICLFCDQIFTNGNEAKIHIESHFHGVNEAIDDSSVTKEVKQWIQQFLLKQSQLASYENITQSTESYAYYRCPLCVKLSTLNQRIAKKYKTFDEVESHLCQHSCWLSVKCKVCSILLPNCDSFIANHIKNCHKKLLTLAKNQNLKHLLENNIKIEFKAEHRLELEKDFITFVSDRVIDPFIKRLLIEIKAEREEQLRVINNCHRFNVGVIVDRLPKLDLDNSLMIRKYLNDWETKEKLRKVIELQKNINREKVDETVVPQKKLKLNDNEFEVIDNESDCEILDETIVLNDEPLNEDLNALGRDIDKVYDKIICFDTTHENVGKKSANYSESVPSTSRANSCDELIKDKTWPQISVDKNVIQNKVINSLEEEEFHRFCCYHCNDKFKTMKLFREHHKKQHKRQVIRCYGKKRVRP